MVDLQQQLHTLAERMTADQAARDAEATALAHRIDQLEWRVQQAEALAEAAHHPASMSDTSIDALKVRQ